MIFLYFMLLSVIHINIEYGLFIGYMPSPNDSIIIYFPSVATLLKLFLNLAVLEENLNIDRHLL